MRICNQFDGLGRELEAPANLSLQLFGISAAKFLVSLHTNPSFFPA
jgi:hypothetical protein